MFYNLKSKNVILYCLYFFQLLRLEERQICVLEIYSSLNVSQIRVNSSIAECQYFLRSCRLLSGDLKIFAKTIQRLKVKIANINLN